MARTGQAMPASSYATLRVNAATKGRLVAMVKRRQAEGERATMGGMIDELVKAAADEEA